MIDCRNKFWNLVFTFLLDHQLFSYKIKNLITAWILAEVNQKMQPLGVLVYTNKMLDMHEYTLKT